jgi:signal peptidase I
MHSKDKSKDHEWSWKDLLWFVVITVVIVLPIRLLIAQPFIVSGDSMYPTFESGEYLIVDQVTYRLSEPERGDVIVFRFPQDRSKFFIKRIIGLPGETIDFSGREVIITNLNGNSFTLPEEYVQKEKSNLPNPVTLTGSQYFVMGDNRLESLDSRTWGPLEKKDIIGRALVRLLPFSRADWQPGHVFYEQIN